MQFVTQAELEETEWIAKQFARPPSIGKRVWLTGHDELGEISGLKVSEAGLSLIVKVQAGRRIVPISECMLVELKSTNPVPPEKYALPTVATLAAKQASSRPGQQHVADEPVAPRDPDNALISRWPNPSKNFDPRVGDRLKTIFGDELPVRIKTDTAVPLTRRHCVLKAGVHFAVARKLNGTTFPLLFRTQSGVYALRVLGAYADLYYVDESGPVLRFHNVAGAPISKTLADAGTIASSAVAKLFKSAGYDLSFLSMQED